MEDPLLLPPIEPPVLGELVLGDLVLEEPELLLGVLLEPELMPLPVLDDEPPAAPDLLKWASHSARETWPSLFLSTSEKLGLEDELADEPPADEEPVELAPLLEPEADGEDDEDEDGVEDDEPVDEEPAELPPEAAGDDEVDGLDADGLDDEEDDCATAYDDSAKITAAAVMLRVLGIRFSGVVERLPIAGCNRYAEGAGGATVHRDGHYLAGYHPRSWGKHRDQRSCWRIVGTHMRRPCRGATP